jgi:hypothetical protein
MWVGPPPCRLNWPVGCIAVANDEEQTLAMLKRRSNESIVGLLHRLDQAVERAVEHEEYIDEVNT